MSGAVGDSGGWRSGAGRPEPVRAVPPMLAVAGELPVDDGAYGYEFKWDGVRAGAVVRFGTARLISRNQRDVTANYPELAVLADLTGGRSAVLDGEIVALDETGVPSFGVLQRRINVRDPSRPLRADVPVRYYVFDVVHLDGWSTRRMRYLDRRGLLDELGLAAPGIETSPMFLGGGPDVLQVSRDRGLEGVLAKRWDSPYQPGRRSGLWIKVKLTRSEEVLVGGWKPGRGRRGGTVGSLLVGVPAESGGLRYAGHVGTGFTEAILADLADRLRGLARSTSPFTGPMPAEHAKDARWVHPRMVGEVRFTEWTRDGLLRHPSWRGLRPDKAPPASLLTGLGNDLSSYERLCH